MDHQNILEVKGLYKHFPVSQSIYKRITFQPLQHVHAVDNVSFSMKKGEILALVGESGSGKTTIGMNVLGLQVPTKGKVIFDGYNVAEWAEGRLQVSVHNNDEGLSCLPKRKQIMALRRRAQMIFQDPYESLNPRQKVFDIVAEPLDIHQLVRSEQDKTEKVRSALESSGLAPADHFWDRYPDGLSGGQRQRVVIAGALVLEPDLLVADEPVSMLDVSVRAELLTLLNSIREERGISILYTTHDLATAGIFTDRMAVMYLGRIVELGGTRDILLEPQHPYTQALLSVVPVPNPRDKVEKVILEGEVPNPINLPSGCRFHPRCPFVMDKCRKIGPTFVEVGTGHQVACLLFSE
jgi:peptide/nickel transport system ATP-binding protein